MGISSIKFGLTNYTMTYFITICLSPRNSRRKIIVITLILLHTGYGQDVAIFQGLRCLCLILCDFVFFELHTLKEVVDDNIDFTQLINGDHRGLFFLLFTGKYLRIKCETCTVYSLPPEAFLRINFHL
jgi:hypothetical protein